MSDELFKKQREGYIGKKIEIPKKMQSQAEKFWDEITNHQFCFNRRKRRRKKDEFLFFIFLII
jgi:hypothetical protein